MKLAQGQILRINNIFVALSLMVLVAVSPPLSAQEMADAVFTDTIEGKQYRIAPGEKPGTWQVSYGDDTLLWEPKSWMDPDLVKEGPKFFQRWNQTGLPYPWEIGAAERVALARAKAGELSDRYHSSTVFFAFGKSMLDVAALPLIDARGNVREKILQEWGQSYVPAGHNWDSLPGAERGVIERKYLWVYRSPSEVKGLGGRTVVFTDRNRNPDEWLYTPTTRKVRRLSSGVSQDYLPGTIMHIDQLSHTTQLPDLDYKLVNVELWKGRGTAIGIRPEDDQFSFEWPDGRPQAAIAGIGDLALVVEITPKAGVSWWFSKLYRRFSVYSGNWMSDEAYNAKGELIQTLHLRNMLPPEDKRASLPPYYVHWGQIFVHEPQTGIETRGYQDEPIVWDADLPLWLFDQNTLVREPTSLIFW